MSATERKFMEVIWRKDCDLNLQDFMRIFSEEYDKHWEKQTVSTFLSRLVKKEYLTAYRQGRFFYYRPTMSRLEVRQRDIDQAIMQQFGMALTELIEYYEGGEVDAKT